MADQTDTKSHADHSHHSGQHGGTSGDAKPEAAALDLARDKVGSAYEAALDKTAGIYGSAKDAASGLAGKAAAGVEENPLAVLIGGLALGALAGALVPRSQREIEALAPLGEKLKAAAQNATAAGKEAGIAKLGELGFHKEDLLDKAREVIEQAIAAARSTGTAAAGAATDAARDAVQS